VGERWWLDSGSGHWLGGWGWWPQRHGSTRNRFEVVGKGGAHRRALTMEMAVRCRSSAVVGWTTGQASRCWGRRVLPRCGGARGVGDEAGGRPERSDHRGAPGGRRITRRRCSRRSLGGRSLGIRARGCSYDFRTLEEALVGGGTAERSSGEERRIAEA
jgi:hypothetical protein